MRMTDKSVTGLTGLSFPITSNCAADLTPVPCGHFALGTLALLDPSIVVISRSYRPINIA
jgi:hypothetical protein